MGKKCDLSPCKKAEVKALVNAKLFSNRKISPRLKVSKASVRRIKKKIESGDELSPKRKKKMRQKAYFHPKTMKHPTKIMIWSVISGKGTGRLDVVKDMMRQDQYKDVLQNRLISQLEEWFLNEEPYIVMQDGAPCHTDKTVLERISKNFGSTKYPSVGLA
ncbi:uncharacterized protein TNCV_2798751 [Trichonephila clavipes]|nr:uncharacterized protein TNCV_2798751 [Trichonephila clavipes]